MSNIGEDRYVFVSEWYDQMAALIRSYQLRYFPADKTLEMYDVKNKRMFLKRCEYPQISIKDLYLGSVLTIFARQIKLVDYGDVYTKKKFESTNERTFAMVKPDAYTHIGKIVDIIYTNGFQITKLKMAKMTQQNAQEFYAEHIGKPFFPNLSAFITSDVVVGMELVADSAVSKWRNLIGPTDTTKAKAEAPKSLRAMFGSDATKNAVHGSDSSASAKRELDYFFSNKLGTTAVLNNCSCVAVKPHSVLAGHAGKIIDAILEEGFEISAMEMFYLDKPSSEEFFEVYKQVLPEFVPMVEHMTTGAIIAMEVRQENVIKTLRQLVGPHDPEIAKNLRPNTLRAKYGMDRIKNAIHCTDLEEDGVLECEYFFSLLQQKKDEQAKL